MSTLRVSLPQTAASASYARREVGSFIHEHGLCADPAIAVLILSELVANAVIHGAEPIEVTVSGDTGNVRIEVSDGDTRLPKPEAHIPNADRTGGHGLRIVNTLAQRWGTTIHDYGKTVWAEVPTGLHQG